MSLRTPPLLTFCLFAFLVSLLPGCSANKRVTILVDGERRVIETQASNVAQALLEQNITLGDQDRVEPPDYTPLERAATIQIVRVAIKTETAREPIEFEREYAREENLPEGQVRVSRLGANGQAEIDYQITLEDGREVSRREITRRVIQAPVNELLLVGTQGAVAAVPLTGTLAYIGKGNAWIVRGSTAERRPLTTTGDLDGRVFDLSPDGKYLLYSRAETDKLNSVWLIDTVPFNAEARRVPLENILSAQWAPDGSAFVAYTGGEKTQGAPGWKAYNDLNIAAVYGITETFQVTDTDIQTETVWINPTPLPSAPPPHRGARPEYYRCAGPQCAADAAAANFDAASAGAAIYAHDVYHQHARDDHRANRADAAYDDDARHHSARRARALQLVGRRFCVVARRENIWLCAGGPNRFDCARSGRTARIETIRVLQCARRLGLDSAISVVARRAFFGGDDSRAAEWRGTRAGRHRF